MNEIKECLCCSACEYVGPDYPDSFLIPLGEDRFVCPICAEECGIPEAE